MKRENKKEMLLAIPQNWSRMMPPFEVCYRVTSELVNWKTKKMMMKNEEKTKRSPYGF